MVAPDSHFRPSACAEFSDGDVAEAAAGTLDQTRAGLFFGHLADCSACQFRMMKKEEAFSAALLPAMPGADENEEAIRSFVARIEVAPPSFAVYQPGDVVDKYQVVSLIGKGGTSVVYLCLDLQMDRQVALKMLTHPAYSGALKDRHIREARSLARLDHPWIVKAFEIKPFHVPPFIVMEYVPGGASGSLLKNGPLAPAQAARLVAGVARAVAHAHKQGIIHRDIKPSNLLVVQPFEADEALQEELSLKVSDFGLARPISADSQLTSVDHIVGTPAYMSPEQSGGNPKKLGPASDIYSIGVVLYEYLIGRPPLVAENAIATLGMINDVEPVSPRQIRPGIPVDLDTICMKCLRKDPAERYASAGELADDLQRYLENHPILARPVGPVERLQRWCRRNRRLAASLAFSTLLIVLTAIGGVWFGFEQARLLNTANSARLEALRQTQRAEAAAREAEASRIMALKDRDATVKIMDDATSALYASINQISGSKLAGNPEARQLRNQMFEAFLKIATNIQAVETFEREKPDYLCGLLFKTAVLRWSAGAKDEGRDLLERMLLVHSRISEPLKSLDGLTAQMIAANGMLGDLALERKATDAAVRTWLACWSDYYGKGEPWFRVSGTSVELLNRLGHRLCDLLKKSGQTADLQRIEPQLQNLERIRNEIRSRG